MAGITEDIEIPEGVTVSVSGSILTAKGPKGEVSRDFFAENITVSTEARKVTVSSPVNKKNQRKIIGSFKAHIKNILIGVVDGHHVKMKILSGHFPMTVAVKDKEFSVKNFFGEKTARTFTLPEGSVEVKIKGDDIEIESCDKELVGSVMGSIEQLTRRTTFDRRIFQDGIVLVKEK